MTDQTTPAAQPDPLFDDWMSRTELARTIGLTTDTLARWESRRIGPPCVRVGRTVLYRRGAVKDWLITQEEQKVAASKRGRR